MHRDEHGNQAEDGQDLTAVQENTTINWGKMETIEDNSKLVQTVWSGKGQGMPRTIPSIPNMPVIQCIFIVQLHTKFSCTILNVESKGLVPSWPWALICSHLTRMLNLYNPYSRMKVLKNPKPKNQYMYCLSTHSEFLSLNYMLPGYTTSLPSSQKRDNFFAQFFPNNWKKPPRSLHPLFHTSQATSCKFLFHFLLHFLFTTLCIQHELRSHLHKNNINLLTSYMECLKIIELPTFAAVEEWHFLQAMWKGKFCLYHTLCCCTSLYLPSTLDNRIRVCHT
jgi:hypothetical protein